MPPRIVSSREVLRDVLGKTNPGLVPTMGALHAGHVALITRSAQENEVTVVSIFVNPTQFGDPRDLAKYPRDLEHDVDLASEAGANLIFAPSVEAIYPPGFDSFVEVGDLARRWEGAARPGHFRGVATVVTILLNLVRPRRAYFGEKDYQQLQIIRRMHGDLALPGEVVGCPTVRDEDGLALSSRNVRLSLEARERAAAIPRVIERIQASAQSGNFSVADMVDAAATELTATGLHVEYVAIVEGATLEPLERFQPNARILVAAQIDGIRLIDNAPVNAESIDRTA